MTRPRVYVVSGFTVDADEAGNTMQALAVELQAALGYAADVLYREHDDGVPDDVDEPRTAIIAHSYGVGNYTVRFLRRHPQLALLFSIDGVACPLAGWPIGWLTRLAVAFSGWGRIRVPIGVGRVHWWRQTVAWPRGSRILTAPGQLGQCITLWCDSDHSRIITQAAHAAARVVARWVHALPPAATETAP